VARPQSLTLADDRQESLKLSRNPHVERGPTSSETLARPAYCAMVVSCSISPATSTGWWWINYPYRVVTCDSSVPHAQYDRIDAQAI